MQQRVRSVSVGAWDEIICDQNPASHKVQNGTRSGSDGELRYALCGHGVVVLASTNEVVSARLAASMGRTGKTRRRRSGALSLESRVSACTLCGARSAIGMGTNEKKPTKLLKRATTPRRGGINGSDINGAPHSQCYSMAARKSTPKEIADV